MFRSLKITRPSFHMPRNAIDRKALYLLHQESNEDSILRAANRCQNFFTISTKNKPNESSSAVRVRLARSQDVRQIMKFVRENFVHEEPLMKSLNIASTRSTLPLETIIATHLKNGFTMIAVEGQKNVVGLALNLRNCYWDGSVLQNAAEKAETEPLKKLFYIWSIVSSEPKLHERFMTPCIFELAMLATARDFQRRGIGYQLTMESLRLARDLGYQVARMDCTSEYSSRLADRVGLECIWSVPYNHLVDGSRKPVAKPEHPHTHIRVHAAKLENFN
ncbi:uncharacterized protein LOC129749700 [Uranotaenia lowii]|uniref:uncharacterized protein LOC129749700 n=1 Tax=Uranotaenia lowii TaxID=190385 RepID=UPI00247A77E7|nr:uncharacterized protein LOC129749700 [Uranotaenia lowii]